MQAVPAAMLLQGMIGVTELLAISLQGCDLSLAVSQGRPEWSDLWPQGGDGVNQVFVGPLDNPRKFVHDGLIS